MQLWAQKINYIKPENKLYKKLKSVSKDIIWTRLENLSLLGTPDLLGYNNHRHFFTVELKVANGNRARLSCLKVSNRLRLWIHRCHRLSLWLIRLRIV
jgi:hypothetical protein